MPKILVISVLLLCGCKTYNTVTQDYLYYVIDVNGELPDAQFTKRKDAEKYVSYFKEHHTYRIVKAQHWANHDE